MKTIDFPRIVKQSGLELNVLAKHLFEKNKHPRLALDRILSGKASLDAEQIGILSDLTGLGVSELFSNSGWKSSSTRTHKNKITFEKGDYRAVLNLDRWETTIYHKNKPFRKTLLSKGAISLEEYLNALDDLTVLK